MLSTNTTLDPTRMSAAERLDEIAELLAAGLIRLKLRKSTRVSADLGERFVDYAPHPSGHARHPNKEVAR